MRMYRLPRLVLTLGLFALTLPAAVINFTVTNVGANVFRYNYTVSAVTFQANQELDIRFDPALYSTLTSGVAPSGFSLDLFQPNNPPQAFGDYSAVALVNNPSLT